ncbi:MAG: threonylcarbamoyl-AMP synthase [Oscillospiraceae bacterium]|nr:threonylcarbamoyl-AMP synthase [Oscillospiraceae bacterium]
MNTIVLTPYECGINRAAEILKNGGLVAIPTETVYGLAANALDQTAVLNIFKAKNRPADNPLIVHIANFEDIEKFNLAAEFPTKAKLLVQSFWPGPLTVVVKRGESIPPAVNCGLSTVAIRMPAHTIARKVIAAAGVPLAAPSANSSGKPSPTTAQHVIEDLHGSIDAVLDGGECAIGVESTVISFSGKTPLLLRPGGITVEQIEGVIGKIAVSPAITAELPQDAPVESPGLKHKHYSPSKQVTLIDATPQEFVKFVNSHSNCGCLCYNEDFDLIKTPKIAIGAKCDYAAQAKALFAALRLLDEMQGVEQIFAPLPLTDGMGLAVYNRLIRAAGFNILKL